MSDEPITDQERWAEQEARACDNMIRYMREETVPGWLDRLNQDPINETAARMLAEISIRRQVWQQCADMLRRPRRLRIEREAYARLDPAR